MKPLPSPTLFTVLFFSLTASAGEFPGSLWESGKIPGAVMGAEAAELDGDGLRELLYILPHRLVVTSFTAGAGESASAEALDQESFHRLHAGDFNGDGKTEILVNGFLGGAAFARLYAMRDGKLAAVQDFRGTVMPFGRGGAVTLYLQTLRGRGGWSHRAQALTWDGSSYREAKAEWRLTSGIGENTASLYAIAGLGGAWMQINDDGTLTVRDDAGRRLWKSGATYGGAVDRVGFEERDPLGISRASEFSLQARVAPDPASGLVFVAKNEGFLPRAIGAFPTLKSATLVTFAWTGESLQERASTPRYDGAIADVAIADYDGDGVKDELMLTLWTRRGGVLDASRPKVSVIAVIARSAGGTPPKRDDPRHQ